MKKILVVNGNPVEGSLTDKLCEIYHQKAIESGAECQLLIVRNLDFELSLKDGYSTLNEPEPDLKRAQKLIFEADHLVWIYPTWWGTYPALLKGFIDRVFLPGYAFRYRTNSRFWDKLLKGRTARLITTMDAPWFYYMLYHKRPGDRSLKLSILKFCGINPVRITHFCSVRTASPGKIDKWEKKVAKLAKRMI